MFPVTDVNNKLPDTPVLAVLSVVVNPTSGGWHWDANSVLAGFVTCHDNVPTEVVDDESYVALNSTAFNVCPVWVPRTPIDVGMFWNRLIRTASEFGVWSGFSKIGMFDTVNVSPPPINRPDNTTLSGTGGVSAGQPIMRLSGLCAKTTLPTVDETVEDDGNKDDNDNNPTMMVTTIVVMARCKGPAPPAEETIIRLLIVVCSQT